MAQKQQERRITSRKVHWSPSITVEFVWCARDQLKWHRHNLLKKMQHKLQQLMLFSQMKKNQQSIMKSFSDVMKDQYFSLTKTFFSNSPFKYYPKWHSVIKVKTVPPLEFLHIFNQLITHQISANTTNPRDDKFSSTPIKQNIPNGIFKLNSSGFYRHMAYDVERNSFTVFFCFLNIWT